MKSALQKIALCILMLVVSSSLSTRAVAQQLKEEVKHDIWFVIVDEQAWVRSGRPDFLKDTFDKTKEVLKKHDVSNKGELDESMKYFLQQFELALVLPRMLDGAKSWSNAVKDCSSRHPSVKSSDWDRCVDAATAKVTKTGP